MLHLLLQLDILRLHMEVLFTIFLRHAFVISAGSVQRRPVDLHGHWQVTNLARDGFRMYPIRCIDIRHKSFERVLLRRCHRQVGEISERRVSRRRHRTERLKLGDFGPVARCAGERVFKQLLLPIAGG